MILNLSNGFTPYGKGNIEFEQWRFPGGELGIRLPSILNSPSPSAVKISARIIKSDDIMLLLLATDALKRMGIEDIEVFIPYIPYGRQDKMLPGESLSIKVICDLINSQEYKKIITFDPHSEVTTALINNCRVMNNYDFIGYCISGINNLHILCPDMGASKKVYGLIKSLNIDTKLTIANKIRNPKNGAIEKMEIDNQNFDKSDNVFVVDDICDGGATFIALAQAITSEINSLSLAVSHGIFSKGFDELAKLYKNIYTTNSFYNGISNPSGNLTYQIKEIKWI